MGIKPKTSFRRCIPTRCPRRVAAHPTHIPRRPKKKSPVGVEVGGCVGAVGGMAYVGMGAVEKWWDGFRKG